MVFLDSYYSINFDHNGQKKEIVYNNQKDILRLRRDEAVKGLDNLLEKIRLEKIDNYSIEFVFWERYIQTDIDDVATREFDAIQKDILVTINHAGVKLNFHNLKREAQNMVRTGANFTGKMVKIKNDKGEEIDVLNDKLLRILDIDFEYFEWD